MQCEASVKRHGSAAADRHAQNQTSAPETAFTKHVARHHFTKLHNSFQRS